MSRYIDADKALEIWKDQDYIKLSSQETKARIMLDAVPSADVVEVRHGHWEPVFDKIESNLSDIGYFKALPKFICSECGNEMIASTQYCPNCGAKMDGEEQEQE